MHISIRLKIKSYGFSIKRRRKPGPSGGAALVPVAPDRPKILDGGAAVALEFDD